MLYIIIMYVLYGIGLLIIGFLSPCKQLYNVLFLSLSPLSLLLSLSPLSLSLSLSSLSLSLSLSLFSLSLSLSLSPFPLSFPLSSPQIQAASEKLTELKNKSTSSGRSTPTASTASPLNLPSASDDVLVAQKKRFEELKVSCPLHA